MRIRQLKPTYFLDKALWTQCRAETREFYQGLWLIADDAGWFEWDVTSIAAEIYRFVGVAKRERDVERHAGVLQELQPSEPHLVLHSCGHAEVPKMPQHQRISDTKRVRSDFDRHRMGRCPALSRGEPRNTADLPHGKEREQVGNGKEQVVGARAQDEKEPTPFRVAMAGAGYRR